MAAWRVARSLDILLAQINTRAAKRSKRADGSIGDAAHRASTSDHNPDSGGVVRARDFTHDPGNGADMHVVTEQLRVSHDPRIKYVIFDHRMFSSYPSGNVPPFTWRAYAGTADVHDTHAHVSVVADGRADDARSWAVWGVWGVAPAAGLSVPYPGRVLKLATPNLRGEDIRRWQQRMRDTGHQLAVDGIYGPGSAAVCRSLQAARGLAVDGQVGPKTWAASFV